MSIVTLDGQKTSACNAILWANREFGNGSFRVQHQFPGWYWRFEFGDPKQATHFALKWIK